MLERQGRGAWPSDGRGGTLKNPTTPGKYYLLGEGWNKPGLAAVLRFIDGQPIPLDELAVHYGVKAIQRLLNDCDGLGVSIKVDGVFGPDTDYAVKKLQKIGSIKVDGVVGPNTMKTLMFLPVVDGQDDDEWHAIWGILYYEGGWDPGAVGYADKNDWGLAQVNTIAHPRVSMQEAFDPYWAIDFIENYLYTASLYLGDNIRDQVASYNLGIGGARQWIAAGRPDVWLPSWSTIERRPNEYIDRILNAYRL
jgi:hypothetical protein